MRKSKICRIAVDILEYLESVEVPACATDSISTRLRIKLGLPEVDDNRFSCTPKSVDLNKPYRADYSVRELAVGESKIFPWRQAGKYPYALSKAVKLYAGRTGKKFYVDYAASGRKVTRLR